MLEFKKLLDSLTETGLLGIKKQIAAPQQYLKTFN
jgi:hypothetical protein